MFHNYGWWIGGGVFIGLALFYFFVLGPALWKADKERLEREKERKKAEAVRQAERVQQVKNLRRQRLVVYIREKDGRKSSFETVLTRVLLNAGITVEPFPETSGRAIADGDTTALKNGLLAVVGTVWFKKRTSGGYEDTFAGDIPLRTHEVTHCDYRFLAPTDRGTGKILRAGYDHDDEKEGLAVKIMYDLASALSE